MRTSKFCLKLVILALLFIIEGAALAQQRDLVISSKRIVFDGTKRSEIIYLTNPGTDTVKYNISFLQMKMDDFGNFVQITEPDSGQYFADPYLRFYPRSVTLPPKESQAVKVQVTRSSQLAQGEYRSHLYFRSEYLTKALGEEQPAKEDSTVSIRLIPIYGFTIPCIIIMGESNTNVAITNLKFTRSAVDHSPRLSVEFQRTGNMSAYGHIEVHYTSPDGIRTTVAKVNGIAIYSPGTIRKASIKLNESDGVDYTEGTLTATFSESLIKMTIPMAKAEFSLSQN